MLGAEKRLVPATEAGHLQFDMLNEVFWLC